MHCMFAISLLISDEDDGDDYDVSQSLRGFLVPTTCMITHSSSTYCTHEAKGFLYNIIRLIH